MTHDTYVVTGMRITFNNTLICPTFFISLIFSPPWIVSTSPHQNQPPENLRKPEQTSEETSNSSSSHKVFHIHEAHGSSNKKDIGSFHGSSNKEAHKSNKVAHTGNHKEAYIGSHGISNKDTKAHIISEAYIGSHSSRSPHL
jgi:hypothetical protein